MVSLSWEELAKNKKNKKRFMKKFLQQLPVPCSHAAWSRFLRNISLFLKTYSWPRFSHSMLCFWLLWLREKKDKVRWIWEKEEKHSEIKQLQMQEFIGCLFMTYIVKLLPVLGIRALKYPDCKLAWGCHALGVIKTHRGKSNTPGCSVPTPPLKLSTALGLLS